MLLFLGKKTPKISGFSQWRRLRCSWGSPSLKLVKIEVGDWHPWVRGDNPTILCTWNPNNPCFEWTLGLCLKGSTPQKEGQTGSMYIYSIYILFFFCMPKNLRSNGWKHPQPKKLNQMLDLEIPEARYFAIAEFFSNLPPPLCVLLGLCCPQSHVSKSSYLSDRPFSTSNQDYPQHPCMVYEPTSRPL